MVEFMKHDYFEFLDRTIPYGLFGLRELQTREIGAREIGEKLLFSPAWS
jgi:hypothetical protein